MKKISELTREELINLTEDDIKNIVDYECALRGIQLLPKEPTLVEFKKPKEDLQISVIGDLYFQNSEDASKVLDVIKTTQLLEKQSKNWNDYYVTKLNPGDYDYPKIDVKSIYSNDVYKDNEKALDDYRENKKIYETEKEEYDKLLGKVTNVKDELNSRIKKAWDYINDVQNYTNIFNRYLQLAENDKEIAKNFMLNAYPNAETYVEITKLWED